MGSADGAVKTAARRAGISVAEYERLVAAGKKRCTSCTRWRNRSAFGNDRSRSDGLAARCRDCASAAGRAAYVPKVRQRGRSFVPARDGDSRQARRRINYFVEAGLIPRPNDLPCRDCGHVWKPGGRRHEYDHHLGYAAENHEHVEPVCSRCHHEREMRRADKH